jgi:CRISPR-associated endonuclease Csn1
MAITLSFDIGYASIGWCVLSAERTQKDPDILGTGVVTFPTDDCLASKRRDLRRTRRHIRSTRQRIERMKGWLVQQGVLSREDLDRPGHPAPFLLAAAALQGHRTLTAWELWTVLRWYAHNRGYDGNSLWSRDETNDDDTEKETNAKALMTEYGTPTMAETVCKCLGLDPADHATRISSALPYKTLNAAYPRETVYQEVGKILCKHTGVIPNLDTETVRFLLKPLPPNLWVKPCLTAAKRRDALESCPQQADSRMGL